MRRQFVTSEDTVNRRLRTVLPGASVAGFPVGAATDVRSFGHTDKRADELPGRETCLAKLRR
jgi:hypothetical protein